MSLHINIKNQFPLKDGRIYDKIKETIVKKGQITSEKMMALLAGWQKTYKGKLTGITYSIFQTKDANIVKNLMQDSTNQIALGFSMLKLEEFFCLVETLNETHGPKQGEKRIQEAIDQKRKEFEYLKEKFPMANTVRQSY